jgi:coenzyme F420-reducing hydrogenase gamma subunit
VCILITEQKPCLGPVTQIGGCNARCPAANRPCQGCGGQQHKPNLDAMKKKLLALGIPSESVAKRFQFLKEKTEQEK